MNSGQLWVGLGVLFLTVALLVFIFERKNYGTSKGISKTEFFVLIGVFGGAGVLALIIGIIVWYRKSKKGG